MFSSSVVVSFASSLQLQFTIIMIIPSNSKKNQAQKCLLFNISNRDVIAQSAHFTNLLLFNLTQIVFFFSSFLIGHIRIIRVSGNWVTGQPGNFWTTDNPKTTVPCKNWCKRDENIFFGYHAVLLLFFIIISSSDFLFWHGDDHDELPSS